MSAQISFIWCWCGLSSCHIICKTLAYVVVVGINAAGGWFGSAGSGCLGGRSKGSYVCVVVASLTCHVRTTQSFRLNQWESKMPRCIPHMWMEKLIKKLPQENANQKTKPPTKQNPPVLYPEMPPQSTCPESWRNAVPALQKMDVHKWPLCPELGTRGASPTSPRAERS